MLRNQRNSNFPLPVWNRNCSVSPVRSLIEICGQRRVLIEHHCGVHSYGCCDISVKVSYGLVCISGEALQLRFLSKEKLVITGKIKGITLCEEMAE